MSIAEQIADELISQRPYTARPWKRRSRKSERVRGGARKLTLAEVAEFKGTVIALLRARCRYGDWCWQPGCQRCDPVTLL